MNKRTLWPHDFFILHTNQVIRFLILGDLIFFAATGLLGPIFAIFVEDHINGGSAAVAGIAVAVFLVTRSLVQIPAARIIDKLRGDRDDFWFMFGGLFAAALIQMLYLFIKTPFDLYLVQFLLGIALAFNFPSFMALFTKHIANNREATMWGVYYTFFDLVSAAAAAIGGVIATMFGFKAIILVGTIIGVIGALMLLPMRKHIRGAQNC